jgi:hypothetical protein
LADQTTKGSRLAALRLLILKKAVVGIEPTNKGFPVESMYFFLLGWLCDYQKKRRGIGPASNVLIHGGALEVWN